MKIIYTPQRSDMAVKYEFGEDKVIAYIDGNQETFSFREMPDGRAESITADNLPVCPVMSAERVDGELTVTLLHWYGADAEDWEKEQREEVV